MATRKSKSGSARGRAWKVERASVHRSGAARPRTNKHSGGDTSQKPGRGSRVWVGGYTRRDGVEVAGHYREATAG
jgi:hypothetical protein